MKVTKYQIKHPKMKCHHSTNGEHQSKSQRGKFQEKKNKKKKNYNELCNELGQYRIHCGGNSSQFFHCSQHV